jgi:cell division protein ZapD
MQQSVLYEFPLNERMRIFMRLENCFAQIKHLTQYNSIWDNQASILILIEVLNIMERNDVKNEISKELDRSIATLNNLLDLPKVDTNRLQSTLDALYTQLHAIQSINGRAAKTLREDDLLGNIKQRAALTANINNFEIPSYYYWQNQSPALRQQQLAIWLAEITPLADALSLLLNLIRDSAIFETKTATAGFFQTSLNGVQLCQMVRIEIPTPASFFPETSGNKHRVSVRFMNYENSKQRPTPITTDIEFRLSCCGF